MNLSQFAKFGQFLNELPAIAERADRERAGVYLDALVKEFPEIWEELVFCSKMDSPQTVIAYLSQRNAYFVFLRQVPNVNGVIQFLMDFIKERSQSDDSSNHSGFGNVVRHTETRRPARRPRVRA